MSYTDVETKMAVKLTAFIKNAWAEEPELSHPSPFGPRYNSAHTRPLHHVQCLGQPGHTLQPPRAPPR